MKVTVQLKYSGLQYIIMITQNTIMVDKHSTSFVLSTHTV